MLVLLTKLFYVCVHNSIYDSISSKPDNVLFDSLLRYINLIQYIFLPINYVQNFVC